MLVSGIKISTLVDCMKISIREEDTKLLYDIFALLGQHQVNIWFEVQVRDDEGTINVTLCVGQEETKKTLTLITSLAPDLALATIPALNILSVFPFRDNPAIPHLLLSALAEQFIPVLAVSTSLSSVSCLLHQEHCSKAHALLNQKFLLSSSATENVS